MRTTLAIAGSIFVCAGCASDGDTHGTETPQLDSMIESVEDLTTVDRVAAEPEGALVLGGRASAGDTHVAVLIRLTPEGELDEDYGFEGHLPLHEVLPEGVVTDLVAVGEGKVLVSGRSSAGGWIARVTSKGEIDPDFAGGGLTLTEDAMALTVRDDGSVLAALDAHAGQVIGVALVATGALDTAIGEDGFLTAAQFVANDEYNGGRTVMATAEAITISAVMEGDLWQTMYYLDGTPRFRAKPSTPPSMDPRGVVAYDGGFVVGGLTGDGEGMTAVKFDVWGSIPVDFAWSGIARTGVESADMAILADTGGKIVMAGSTMVDTSEHPALVRLLADGSPDPTLDGDGILVDSATAAHVSDAAVLGDGSVVVVGSAANQGFLGQYAMP